MNSVVKASILDIPVTYPANERDPNQDPHVNTLREIYKLDFNLDEGMNKKRWNWLRLPYFVPALIDTIIKERGVEPKEAFNLIKDDLMALDPMAFQDFLDFMEGMSETHETFRDLFDPALLSKGDDIITSK